MVSENILGTVPDDPSAVDAARKRVAKSPRKYPWAKAGSRRSWASPDEPLTIDLESLPATHSEPNLPPSPTHEVIDLGIPPTQSVTRDEYRWAMVYENQRGIVLFSVPYFSRLSLLPRTDPCPYTLPDASTKRSRQPDITLDTYPLPSGQWKWVSKQWMIDMRSEAGQVQHDGFEYNWIFQKHHWRSEVGKFSAGGFVRRRKWIRLMVLPASGGTDLMTGDLLRPTVLDVPPAQFTQGRRSPESTSNRSGLTSLNLDPDQIWLDEDVAMSWKKYNLFLPELPSDGHRLEAWCGWLGLPSGYILRHKEIRWTEDERKSRLSMSPSSTPVPGGSSPVGNVLLALADHYNEIFQSFIYPQSRADFLKLLALSGSLTKLGMDTAAAISNVDFWSYTKGDYSILSMVDEGLDDPDRGMSHPSPVH